MRNQRKFSAVFEKLAAQEQAFFGSYFLGPVMRGQAVRVRLNGVVLNLKIIRPDRFEGWGVYRPLSPKTAEFLREPTMQERRSYLDLFPVLRLIVCDRRGEQFFGIPANHSDTRFKISGVVPIRLAQEVQMFETVQTRFDGENAWFDCVDSGGNLRNAIVLREGLAQETKIEKVNLPSMTEQEKHAYAIAFFRQIEDKKDRNEERLKDALSRAGAQYRSYIERGDTFTVDYTVDGEQHRSVVKKDNLQVESAGICLAGYDRNFDLQSLVGVLREGAERGNILRVGNNPGDYYGHRLRRADELPPERGRYDDDD